VQHFSFLREASVAERRKPMSMRDYIGTQVFFTWRWEDDSQPRAAALSQNKEVATRTGSVLAYISFSAV
jgi:hypothetical protein